MIEEVAAMARKATAAMAEGTEVPSASSHVEYVYPVKSSFLFGNTLYGPPSAAGPGVMQPLSQFVCQTEDSDAPNYCRPSLVQKWISSGCLGEAFGISDPHIVSAAASSGSGFGWAEYRAMIHENAVGALSKLEAAKTNGLLSVEQMAEIRDALVAAPDMRFQRNMLAILGE